MPRKRHIPSADIHTDRALIDAFIDQYMPAMVPPELQSRIVEIRPMVKAAGFMNKNHAELHIRSLGKFLAWSDRDEPLADQLTRPQIHQWSAAAQAAGIGPAYHDAVLSELLKAGALLDGTYRRNEPSKRPRRPGASDAEVEALLDYATRNPKWLALVVAIVGAGHIPTVSTPVIVEPYEHGVVATLGTNRRRVLDEFAALDIKPTTVTLSTKSSLMAAARRDGVAFRPVELRRAWRRRWLAIAVPGAALLTTYAMSNQVIEDAIGHLDEPDWIDVAQMLRGTPTNQGAMR